MPKILAVPSEFSTIWPLSHSHSLLRLLFKFENQKPYWLAGWPQVIGVLEIVRTAEVGQFPPPEQGGGGATVPETEQVGLSSSTKVQLTVPTEIGIGPTVIGMPYIP